MDFTINLHVTFDLNSDGFGDIATHLEREFTGYLENYSNSEFLNQEQRKDVFRAVVNWMMDDENYQWDD